MFIKSALKGAGIIICNYDDYVASCESHLDEKLGDNTPYYKQIGRAAVQDIKSEIKTTIKTALNKSEIEKEIYAELDPSSKWFGLAWSTMPSNTKQDTCCHYINSSMFSCVMHSNHAFPPIFYSRFYSLR